MLHARLAHLELPSAQLTLTPTHPHLELPSAQLTLTPHTPTPHSPTISVRVGGLALTSTEGRDLLSAGEKLSGLVGLAGGERRKLLQEGEKSWTNQSH